MKSPFWLLLLCTACSTHNTADDYAWLSSERLERIQEHGVDTKQRTPLQFTNGQTVSNCRDYLKQNSDVLETSFNFMVRSEYMDCEALRLNKVYPVKTLMTLPGIAESICSALDLHSFRHSLRPRLLDNQVTLNDLTDGKLSKDINSCTYDDSDTYFNLSAVLFVKTPTGQEKLWVEMVDEIRTGTYRTYTGMWFHRTSPTSLWRAIDAP
ncbi:hypothetical protein NQT62_01675 [Limnobacter humi]|uniref:Lipoprotein n=1 Tax=Limnobacter humi TaxID=1778671 RepID=A0ABT1WCB9_9BURK|nr:hypothetical protein [Limnobacter humi]MCQ8895145.1 hypothetical protein [Limnobacter humi]